MFEEWKGNKCGGNWRDVWFSKVYVVSEKKNEKYGDVNKLLKSTSVYKRKKEKKCIDTTKIRFDIVLERKIKKLKG